MYLSNFSYIAHLKNFRQYNDHTHKRNSLQTYGHGTHTLLF